MRIGYDAKRLFCNNTGLGNYSRSLVANQHAAFPGDRQLLFSPRLRRNSDTEPFFADCYDRIAPRSFSPLWRSMGMVRDIKQRQLDIYHGLSHELPIGICNAGCKSIVTIHDLIYKFHPDDFGWIDRKIYDYKFRYACKHADRIIAISNSTKYDLMMHYGVSESKIDVVYQSCSEAYLQKYSPQELARIREKYRLPETFLLSVGSLISRKNILAAVQAVEQLQGIVSLPLVIVGGGGEYKDVVKRYISDKHLEDCVIFPPYISNEDLPALYQMAKIFVYPSRYEGFGIPIIESLWSGTPVITTRMSSLAEAAGPGAWYSHPDQPETIAEGIVRICTNRDYEQTLIRDGFEHVQRFAAKQTTEDMHRVYESVVYKR